ncbi:MMPL family transporter [Kribbella karoonensis]|uniref:MMPL family transporter n=1 Tax=Kribbella karoonensis TaxID=324851 RepID=A0ABN2EH95_9ACTN|nr:MMPL family transporter [Kribbella sp.]
MPGLVRSRRTAALVVLVAVLLAAAALLLPEPKAAGPRSATGLSTAAESAEAERLRAELPQADSSTALIVFSRTDGGSLTVADRTAAQTKATSVGVRAPLQVSENKRVALGVLALPQKDDTAVATAVGELRQKLDGLPTGLQTAVTGPAAFTTDLTKVFDGADTRLIIVTAAVVALLLLLTYRSPGLVLLPLLVVGLTEQVTTRLADQVLSLLGIPGGGQVTGIVSVLVFGAATDYALLLIARYRETLRHEAQPVAAMRIAVRRVAEPILASGGTVIAALTLLLLASTETLIGIAIGCIIGIALAILAGLVVLPAVLVLFGRRVFWPFVPRVGDAATEGKLWGRLGAVVARRPAVVLVLSALVLAGLAVGTFGVRTGLAQNEQFRVKPEAVRGAEILAEAFPAGSTQPLTVVGPAGKAAAVAASVKQAPGVAEVRPGARDARLAAYDVVLTAEPGSPESFAAVRDLRQRLDEVGSDVLVGGGPAEDLDSNDAEQRDRLLIMPLILLLVGAVLVVVLRSVLAPVLLLVTVIASFFASFGASWLLFDHVLGFPALDGQVVLLSFLFLVALGVDYNIFLTTRAREEARAEGTRNGMLIGLRVTGGVITSAGLLLAAVFAVLGVLPLITLTQVGVIVCVGVLLDTLLVRTVVVPALAFLLGDRFWWPGATRGRGGRSCPI